MAKEYNDGLPRKSGAGGARVGAGRKSLRDEANLIAKLLPHLEEATDVLMALVRKGDIQAVKLYFSYAVGLPTVNMNTNVNARIETVDLRDIITFDITPLQDDEDDEGDDKNNE